MLPRCYIHNLVYNATDLLYTQRCANATNILYTRRSCLTDIVICMSSKFINSFIQRRQMATLDAPKVLLLTNKSKLTLTDTVMQKSKTKLTQTVALSLTDTVTVIFLKRILSTPMKRLYRNNRRNFLRRRGSGVCGLAHFFRFLTFYPFADKNSIVSSYFIVEKRVFLWGYIRKGGEVFCGHNRKTKFYSYEFLVKSV